MGNISKTVEPANFMSIIVSNQPNFVINNNKLEIYLSLEPTNCGLITSSAQMFQQQGKINLQVHN